jgi:hypothetical protein
MMGVTSTSLETVDGNFPKVDLEAVVGLKGIPVLRFLVMAQTSFALEFQNHD